MKNERRWNPFLQKWIIVAPKREKRPLDVKTTLDGKLKQIEIPQQSEREEGKPKKKKFCPFCVGAPEVPEPFDVKILPNRFPAIDLSYNDVNTVLKKDSVYKIDSAIGHQEVVLYSPEHNIKFADLPVEHIKKLVELWKERYVEIGGNREIKYVYEFENRGDIIGVSLKHPHGQIYAFSWIPLFVKLELESFKNYHDNSSRCLLCDIIEEELENGVRIIQENENFVSCVPFFAAWPHEVHIYPKKHVQSFASFDAEMVRDFASILKDTNKRYDLLYPNHEMAFVMAIHQQPTDGKTHEYYHFHVEFYPAVRGPGVQKFAAGVELGTGTWINSSLPEDFAQIFKNIKI